MKIKPELDLPHQNHSVSLIVKMTECRKDVENAPHCSILPSDSLVPLCFFTAK